MAPQSTHLIVVCCHAIWTGSDSSPSSLSEEHWLLAPFQSGESPTFIDHIKAGLSLLSTTPDSILVFSGGPTRPETSLSEAESYLRLAQACDFFNLVPPSFAARILTETRALDSFQNVLYGMTLFYAHARGWPSCVTIVSHEFKRRRFLDSHSKALRLPEGVVRFVGLDPAYMDPESGEWDERRAGSVWEGERERGWKVWEEDPLGRGEEVARKRKGRNVWGIGQRVFAGEVGKEIVTRAALSLSILEDGTEVLSGGVQPWEKLE